MALHRRKLLDGSDVTDGDLNDIEVDVGEDLSRKRRRPIWLTRAFASTALHDFKQARKRLGAFELFEQFNQAVGLRYVGDSLTAGVHSACIACQPGDKPIYYLAVHRYPPGNGRDRSVVASCKGPSLEEALRNLVEIWLEVLKTEGPDGSTTEGSPFGKRPEGKRPASHADLTDLLEQSIRNLKR
jgi:hypothetical protein